MRIVSFLPSATEIVCSLGLADELVGITHECDHPPGIQNKPVVVRNAIEMAGMTVTYDAMKHVQVYAKIDNLLDRVYEEVNGFGTFGRSVYGGAKVSF